MDPTAQRRGLREAELLIRVFEQDQTSIGRQATPIEVEINGFVPDRCQLQRARGSGVVIAACIESIPESVYALGLERSCGFTPKMVIVGSPIIGRYGVNPMNVFGFHE